MIIMTKRPASMLMTDTIITTVAWFAFIYQFTKGVVFLLSEHPGTPTTFFGIVLSPTLSILLLCTAVCVFNAMVVYAWARFHNANHTKAYNPNASQDLAPDVLAFHFSLSPRQLGEIQDSRVTVVYHSATGGITHLETGDLQLEEIRQPQPEPQLRVA